MKTVRLPEGGKAWFVRRRRRGHCSLRPASIEGRLLTAAYAAFVTGAAWLVIGDGEDTNAARLTAFIVLILVATFLFILTAWRMSAPAPNAGSGECS